MPGRDVQSGLAVAERLRDKVAGGLDALAQGKRSLTISIGLASLGSSGARTLEDLLGAADIAVYRAKAQGRNRVVRYAPETGVAAIATP
jgi:diguanylate cyclase (GGDEF)-like protein